MKRSFRNFRLFHKSNTKTFTFISTRRNVVKKYLRFFLTKPKPSEALIAASQDEDVGCITPIEHEEVQKQLKKVEEKKVGRSSYRKYTKTERAEIGQYAAKHGGAKTVRKFEIKYPGIKQQSVSDFKRKYNELKRTNPFVSIGD